MDERQESTESAVLRAFGTAENSSVVRLAGWLLGSRGGPESAAALVQLAGTASADRFDEAISGLTLMVARGLVETATLEGILMAAAQREHDLPVARLAISWLASSLDWSSSAATLMGRLRTSEDLDIKVAATCAMARRYPGERGPVGELVKELAPGRFDVQLAHCLMATGDSSDLDALRVLIGSRIRLASQTAEAAFDLIQAIGDGPAKNPAKNPAKKPAEDPAEDPEAQDWRAIEAEEIRSRDASEAELLRTRWIPATRAELAGKLASARLVLFGELHSDGGTLRAGQISALQDFSRMPEREAIGYEPSVLRVQQPVVDAALALGMEAISTEPGWEELMRSRRSWERDRRTAICINDFLSKDSANRMFVVRGEAHLYPTGSLIRSLETPPLVILSYTYATPSFQETQGELDLSGRLFRSRANPNVYRYCLPYSDFAYPRRLIEWIQAHPLHSPTNKKPNGR